MITGYFLTVGAIVGLAWVCFVWGRQIGRSQGFSRSSHVGYLEGVRAERRQTREGRP